MNEGSPLSSVGILPLPGTEYQTLSAACSSVEPGWEIYPIHSVDEQGVCTCPKWERCLDPGKHPATDSGINDASSDPELIAALFSGRAGANVGLRTGRGSGVCVIDIDPRHGGLSSLRKLEAEHGKFPDTREHATGGGTHLCYAKARGVQA